MRLSILVEIHWRLGDLMNGGFIVLGLVSRDGRTRGGLWLKCWGFFPLKSRRELVLSLGVLKSGDSWGLTLYG